MVKTILWWLAAVVLVVILVGVGGLGSPSGDDYWADYATADYGSVE